MVEALSRHGITDPRVLEAMRAVPRDLFVPEAYRHAAYSEDVSINIGEGQTISQPRVVAAMTQAARIGPDDRVLEIRR
jgi:protein-L-isoaspartate(D-aspartate) O-methyltransferase